jgi:hypothetical protein
LFRHLSEEYNLTRFYFIEPDGTAFARLHRPDDYGQKVAHPAVQRAMETTQAASGLELGKVAFALRVVAPYYDGDELIGYIEFGEDIDRILRVLSGTGAEHISVVIEKQYLDRAAWESAAHAESGGAGDWDEYTDVVLSSTTFETLPPEVGRLIADGVDLTTARLVSVGDTVYGIGRVPLTDLLGRRAGYAIMMHDATARVVAVREAVRAQALAGAGIAVIAAALLYVALRSTIRALSSSRTALRIHAALLGEALGREQQMSQTLSIFLAEPELDRALPLLADAARTLTKAGASLIVLRDPHTGTVGRLATSGTPEPPGPLQPLLDESPALAVVVAADDLVSVDDVMALPDFTGYPDYHPKIRAMIGAPFGC